VKNIAIDSVVLNVDKSSLPEISSITASLDLNRKLEIKSKLANSHA